MPASRRRVISLGVLAAIVLGAIMVLLALPMRGIPADAEAARSDLEAAKAAIQEDDIAGARDLVASARVHVDDVQGPAQGIGGDVWSLVPVLGSPVRDVRALGNALDGLTSVAELGVERYAQIADKDRPLFTQEAIDLDALETITESLGEADTHLTRAREELESVADSAPFVGDDAARARDTALETVIPLQEASARFKPLAEQLSGIFGAEGERKYLIAILNPAEQRYSGGTPLTFAPMTVRDGKLDIGPAANMEQPAIFRPIYWKKVQGNPFHRGKLRVTAANFAPSWPVAGEETLNAWRALRGRNGAGLIAIDVVALAALTEITGPMDVPGIGKVDSSNLVETLVGSYERFSSHQARRNANRALIDLFRERIFADGQISEKIAALDEAADGRHFAVYFRDDDVQAAFADLGLSGDLSATEHDYIGSFSQNVVPAKSDYWQRRTITSTVALRADGSARVRQVIDIHNDTTPYPLPGVDPRQGYETRWLHTSVAAFLPRGVAVRRATALGKPFDFVVGDYFDRPFVRRTIVLPPQAKGQVVLDYDVPAAAVVGEDGALTYKLDVDPQGLVIPEALDVTVTWPKGHRLSDLPTGWTKLDTHTAQWRDAGLVTSPRFAITAAP